MNLSNQTLAIAAGAAAMLALFALAPPQPDRAETAGITFFGRTIAPPRGALGIRSGGPAVRPKCAAE